MYIYAFVASIGLRLFHTCRLNDSIEVLKLELQSRGENLDALEGVWEKEKDLVENGLLVSISSQGSTVEYGDQFRSFAGWIVGSLDSLREELSQFLYPIFVYAYVSMIQLEDSASAQDLLTESKDLVLNQTSNENRKEILLKEIHELSKITSPEQLHESSIVMNIMKQKVSVNIASFTYEVLLQYLRQEKLLLMMSLLNRWFSLNIVEDFNSDMMSFWSVTANVDVGTSQIQAQKGKLNIELLKDSTYLRYHEIELKKKIEELEAVEEEEMSKAQKSEHISILESYREKLAKLLGRGMQSSIPLPRLENDQEQNLEEAVHNADKNTLPSCAFASFMTSDDILNAVSVSADFKTLIGGFSDSAIRVYTLLDREKKVQISNELFGHIGPVYSVDQSPKNLIISSSGDGSIRLWSMELSSNLSVYTGHMLPVWDVSFAPAFGHYFASGGADKTCRLWDTERRSCLRAFAGHNSDVEAVKWHPNCQILASGSSDNHIRLWDIASGSCVSVLSGHKAPITCMEFAPNGNLLLSADADGEILCWDLVANSYQNVGRHSGPVWSMAWPEYSTNQIVSGGDDCCVRLWDLEAQEGDTHIIGSWGTKATPVSYVSFSGNGLIFAAGAFSTLK